MKIVTKYLPDTEYYKQKTIKHQIVLHHTVSSTFSSTFNWWQQDGIHVATAYIIDKDGTIYETFDPNYWSYHLGKGTTTLDNKGAIGIEIINEGQLYKRDNGNYYWWINNDYPEGKALYKSDVFDNKVEWRGYRYWADYTYEQYSSVVSLILHLTSKFNIERDIITSFEYNKKLLNHNGIISHHNVRQDKTDVSPSLKLNIIKNRITEMF